MSQYQTAVVTFISPSGDAVRWSFPSVPDTPVEQVHAEVRARLAADPNIDLATVQIQYPAGPYNQPLDRDGLILGAEMPRPVQPPPRQAPRPAAPQSLLVDAPLGASPGYLGPLPTESPVRADPAKDLEQLLSAWAIRHRLSAARYYAYISNAQLQHATRLAQAER